MKYFYFLFLILLPILSVGQPQRINYQAVAHDLSTGDVFSNSTLSIRFSIIPGSPGNPPSYEEEHANVSTNDYGLFNVQIGGGSVISGTFGNINWAGSQHFLRVEVDNGSGYQILGTTQFFSVPYAFYAENAGSSGLSAGSGIDITGGIISNTGDNDNDATNEIQTLNFNATTGTLDLSSSGTVNLSSLINDADADPNNESVNSFGIVGISLQLVESGNTYSIPISSFNDGDWITSSGNLYNSSSNIGIGVTAPLEKLHISGGTLRISNAGSFYNLPPLDGNSGNVMVTDGNGLLNWVDPNTLIAATSTHIFDGDFDTYIHVEASPDEDIIRFQAGGFESMTLNSAGTLSVLGNLQLPTGAANGLTLTSNAAGNASWAHALTPSKHSAVGLTVSVVDGTRNYLGSSIMSFTPEVSGVVNLLYNCRYNRNNDFANQILVGFRVTTTNVQPLSTDFFTSSSLVGNANNGSGGFGDESVTVIHQMSVTAGTTYYVFPGLQDINYNVLAGGSSSNHRLTVTLHKTDGL